MLNFPNLQVTIFAVAQHSKETFVSQEYRQAEQKITWIANSWPDPSLLPVEEIWPPELNPDTFDDIFEAKSCLQRFDAQISRDKKGYERYIEYEKWLKDSGQTLEDNILSTVLFKRNVAVTPNMFPAVLPDDTSHLVGWAVSEDYIPELIREIAHHYTNLQITESDSVIIQNPEYRKSIDLYHVHLLVRRQPSQTISYFKQLENAL